MRDGNGVFAGNASVDEILKGGSVVFDFQSMIEGGIPEDDPAIISLTNYIFARAHMFATSQPQCNGLRFLFLIDEAHRVKPVELLNSIANEGRGYGISLVLGSQRPGHFTQDTLEAAGACLLFSVSGPSAERILRQFFGPKKAVEYVDRVTQQPRCHCAYLRSGAISSVHLPGEAREDQLARGAR
jgi:Type IV secretion-system coupling protein DNA-binding domain